MFSGVVFVAIALFNVWALFLLPSVVQSPIHIGNILIVVGSIFVLAGAWVSFKEWLS